MGQDTQEATAAIRAAADAERAKAAAAAAARAKAAQAAEEARKAEALRQSVQSAQAAKAKPAPGPAANAVATPTGPTTARPSAGTPPAGTQAAAGETDPSVASSRDAAVRAAANARDARSASDQAAQQAQEAHGKRIALEEKARSEATTIGTVGDPRRDSPVARATQGIVTRQQLAQAKADEQGAVRRAVLADQAADQAEQKAQQTHQLAAQTQSAYQAQASAAASTENAKNPSVVASNDPRVLAAAANATADESGALADQARALAQGQNEGASPERSPEFDAETARAVDDAQRAAAQASERASEARRASDSAQRDLVQADRRLREQQSKPQSAPAVTPSDRDAAASLGHGIATSPLLRATLAQRSAQQRAVQADRAADLAEQQAVFAQGYAQQAQATHAAGGDPRVARAAAAACNDEAGVRASQARVAAGLEDGAMPNLPTPAQAAHTAAPASQKPVNTQAAQQTQQQRREAALIEALQADPTVQSAQQSSAQASTFARDARAQADASAKQAEAAQRKRVQLQAQVAAKGGAPVATRQTLAQAKVNEHDARQRAALADKAADQSEQQAQLSQALAEQTVRQRAAELRGNGGADTVRDPYAAVANDSRVSAVASQVAAEQAGLHADEARAASLGLDPATLRPKPSPQQTQAAEDLAKNASAASQAKAKQARALSDDAQRQSQHATQTRAQAQDCMAAASKQGVSDPLAKQQYAQALTAEKQAQLRAKVADHGADIAEQQSRLSQALAQQAERGQAARASGAASTESVTDWRAAVRNDPRVAAMGAVAAADASGQGAMLAQAAMTAPDATLAKWQQQTKTTPAQVAAVPAAPAAGAAAIDATTTGAVRDSTATQQAQTPAALRDPATVQRLNAALAKGQSPATVVPGARLDFVPVKVNGKAAYQPVLWLPDAPPAGGAHNADALSTPATPLALPGQKPPEKGGTTIALGKPIPGSALAQQQGAVQGTPRRGQPPQQKVVRTRVGTRNQIETRLRTLYDRKAQLQSIIKQGDAQQGIASPAQVKTAQSNSAYDSKEDHGAYRGSALTPARQDALNKADQRRKNALGALENKVQQAKEHLKWVNAEIAEQQALWRSNGYVTKSTVARSIEARHAAGGYSTTKNQGDLLDAQVRADNGRVLATSLNDAKGKTVNIGMVGGVDSGTQTVTAEMVAQAEAVRVSTNTKANVVYRDVKAQAERQPLEQRIGDSTDRTIVLNEDFIVALNRGDLRGAKSIAGELDRVGKDGVSALTNYRGLIDSQRKAVGSGVKDRYESTSRATVFDDLRRGAAAQTARLEAIPDAQRTPEQRAQLQATKQAIAGYDGQIGIARTDHTKAEAYYRNWDGALDAQAAKVAPPSVSDWSAPDISYVGFNEENPNPIAGQSRESFPGLASPFQAQMGVDPKTGKPDPSTFEFTLGAGKPAGSKGDYRVTRLPGGQWQVTEVRSNAPDTTFDMSAADSALWENAAERTRLSNQQDAQALRYATTAASLQSAYSLAATPAPSGKEPTSPALSTAQTHQRQLGQQLVQAQDKLIAHPDDAAARATVERLSQQYGLAEIDAAQARSDLKYSGDLAQTRRGYHPLLDVNRPATPTLRAQDVQRNNVLTTAKYDQARTDLLATYGTISPDEAAARSVETQQRTTNLMWRVDHPNYQASLTSRAQGEAWARQILSEDGKAPSQKQVDAVLDGVFNDRHGNLPADGAVTVTASRITVATPDGKGTKDKVVFDVKQTDDSTNLPFDEAGAASAVAAAASRPGNTSTFVVSDGGKTFDDQLDYRKWYAMPNIDRSDAALEALVGTAEAASGFAFGWFGAPIVIDGGARAAHGVEQLWTGKQSDAYWSQALQAAGVKRDTANRIDTGLGLVMGLAGGGTFVFAQGAKGVKGLMGLRRAAAVSEAASAPSAWVSAGQVAAAGGNSYLLGETGYAQGSYVLTGEHKTPLSIQALMKTGMSETDANYLELFVGVGGGLGAKALGNKINGRIAPTPVLEGRVLPREPQSAIEAGGAAQTYDQLAWTGARDPGSAGLVELVPETRADGRTVWRNPQLDSLRRLDTQQLGKGKDLTDAALHGDDRRLMPAVAPRTEGLGTHATMAELLESGALPGTEGVTLKGRFSYGDLYRLSTQRARPVEFALTFENVGGRRVRRLYSGSVSHCPIPPGARPVAHTHPTPHTNQRFASPGDMKLLNDLHDAELAYNPDAAPRPHFVVWGVRSGPHGDYTTVFPGAHKHGYGEPLRAALHDHEILTGREAEREALNEKQDLTPHHAHADAASHGSMTPKGARGPASGREFDPSRAGGPTLDLAIRSSGEHPDTGAPWLREIEVNERGLAIVKQHLARFESDAANDIMVERLNKIAAGKLEATDQDLNFYAHELRESTRYRKLGFDLEARQPASDDAAYDLWNNAHTATLEDYGVPGAQANDLLYHPDAVRYIGTAPNSASGPLGARAGGAPNVPPRPPRWWQLLGGTAAGAAVTAGTAWGGALLYTHLPAHQALTAVAAGTLARAAFKTSRYGHALYWDRQYRKMSGRLGPKARFERLAGSLAAAGEAAKPSSGRATRRTVNFDNAVNALQGSQPRPGEARLSYELRLKRQIADMARAAKALGVEEAWVNQTARRMKSMTGSKADFDMALHRHDRIVKRLDSFLRGVPADRKAEILKDVQALKVAEKALRDANPSNDAQAVQALHAAMGALDSIGVDLRPSSSWVRRVLDLTTSATYGIGFGSLIHQMTAGTIPGGTGGAVITGMLAGASAMDALRINGIRTDELVRGILGRLNRLPSDAPALADSPLYDRWLGATDDTLSFLAGAGLAVLGIRNGLPSPTPQELTRMIGTGTYAFTSGTQFTEGLWKRGLFQNPSTLDPTAYQRRTYYTVRVIAGVGAAALVAASLYAGGSIEPEQAADPQVPGNDSQRENPRSSGRTAPMPGEPERPISRLVRIDGRRPETAGSLSAVASDPANIDWILTPRSQRALGGQNAIEREATRRLAQYNGFDLSLLDGRVTNRHNDPDLVRDGWKVQVNVLGLTRPPQRS